MFTLSYQAISQQPVDVGSVAIIPVFILDVRDRAHLQEYMSIESSTVLVSRFPDREF
jgi:hypothetical protein